MGKVLRYGCTLDAEGSKNGDMTGKVYEASTMRTYVA